MKRISVTILAVLISIISYGQINLEHTYHSPVDYLGYFKICNFSSTTQKYIFYNSNQVKLYGLTHSLYKTISIPYTIYPDAVVVNVSDHLFNSDDLIEVMVSSFSSTDSVKIFDENGLLIWGEKGFIPLGNANNYYAGTFVNTASGTKMIMTDDNNSFDSIAVYGLAGTYLGLPNPNNENHNNEDLLFNPNPNPSKDKTEIQYKLPDEVNEGEIVIYNLNGQEIKKYRVDKTFSNLILDNSELPSGTYLYNLIVDKNIISSKKMIIIK